MSGKRLAPGGPPWLFTATALLAIGALYSTGRSTVLFGIAIALVAVRLTDHRLENGTWPVWIIRLLAGALIFTTGNDPGFRGADTFVTGRSMDWFGQYCAMEMTLQCWIRHPQLPAGKLIGLCVMVFLAASNTVDTGYIRFLAPLYLLFLALAMNALAAPGGSRPVRAAGSTLAVGMVATALALGTGGAGFYGIWIWRGEITRWSNDLLFGNTSEEAGLSTDPRLGATRDLRGPLTRVLRVQELDGPRNAENAHFRGLAFYSYSRGSWGPKIEGRPFRPALPLLAAGEGGRRLRITRLVSNSGFLFVPLGTRSVSVEKGTELLWDLENGRTIRGALTTPLEYEVSVHNAATPPSPLAGPVDLEERGRALELPDEIDPRVRDLARRIAREAGVEDAPGGAGRVEHRGGMGDAWNGRMEERENGGSARAGERTRALIAAVETYLPRHHEYSLTIHPGDGDPVSNFLLERKAAHCEYFASAAVILLRCLGVPARYVSGYYAHETTGTGALIARQRDAHAWAEALVDGEGWVTVEATPASGRPDATDGPIPPWMRLSEWTQDAIDLLRTGIVRSVGITGAVVIGVSVIAFLVWRDIRRQKRSVAEPVYRYSTPPDLEALARRFDQLLGRLGYPCPADRTWNEHLAILARRATEENASGWEDPAAPGLPSPTLGRFGIFVQHYNRARFGGATPPETLADLNVLLQQLESASSERLSAGARE